MPIDIPAILARHNDEHGIQIHLFQFEGIFLFPVMGASGGLVASTIVYFCVGELESRDMARKGLVRHKHGLSWAVELPGFPGDDDDEQLIRAALNDFDEILRAEVGWQ